MLRQTDQQITGDDTVVGKIAGRVGVHVGSRRSRQNGLCSTRQERRNRAGEDVAGSCCCESLITVGHEVHVTVGLRNDRGGTLQQHHTPQHCGRFTSIADAKQIATLYRRSMEMGLPKIPVRPGDKWISDEVIPFAEAGDVQVKLHAKFEGVVDRGGRKHAQIAFEGSMETQPETGTKRSVKVGPNSKVSGQVFFDLERQTITLSVLLGLVNLEVDGKKLPIRQQVTMRLAAMKRSN